MSEQSFSGYASSYSHHKGSFLERIAGELLEAMEHSHHAERFSAEHGLLQRLDPRTKLLGLLLLIITAVSTHSLPVLATLLGVAVVLAVGSRIPLTTVMLKVWLSVLLFTGLIALPALLLVKGQTLYRLPWVGWPITLQGTEAAGFLVGRALTSTSLTVLLILCTPWTHVLKALRVFRVPVVFVVILGMTHRYIFVFLKSAVAMFEAKRSRALAPVNGREARRIAVSHAGFLLVKSLRLSDDVYQAMLSRGYQGDVILMDDFEFKAIDWIALLLFASISALAFWYGF